MSEINGTENTDMSAGLHPRVIGLISLLVPGAGHVLESRAKRGLQFLFFMIIFSWVGNRMFPELSYFARHAGGIFIYGLIAIDAYTIAMRRKHAIE